MNGMRTPDSSPIRPIGAPALRIPRGAVERRGDGPPLAQRAVGRAGRRDRPGSGVPGRDRLPGTPGGRDAHPVTGLQAEVVDAPAGAADLLRAVPGVRYVEPDFRYELSALPDD